MFSMQKQLRYVVEKNKDELHTNITRNMTSGSNPAIISDMTSSAGYLALKDSVGLCHGDLTLTINTDGSPLFESSNTSVWPIQFVLNELPPRTRFKNCTLAGLWIAKTHPDMSVFLAKFVEEVNQMGPLLWEQDGHHYTSRMVVVCCAVDAPARAAVLNMKQHNGYSSCTWCLITYCVRYISSHPVEDRTSALVVRDSQLALELDTDINGVKGPTPLMNLQGFDLVRGCSVEYMHSVLLGVTRQLNDYYFGSSHSSECYYIGSRTHLTKVNRLLLSIKPPHCITRLPRSVTDRAHWKASESRNWLLFYSIPCTADVLPREHWRHLAKLSEAVHILLGEKISERDLARAGKKEVYTENLELMWSYFIGTKKKKYQTKILQIFDSCVASADQGLYFCQNELLKDFVGRCIALYGEAFMTFNVHALLHLAASAKFLGPLWAHSAFVFEGGNGTLVNLVSAAKGAPQQIVERVVMHQELEAALAAGRLPLEEKIACERLLGHPHIQAASYDGGACMLGHGRRAHLSATELQAVEEFTGSQMSSIVEHDRLIYHHQVYNSSAYTRCRKSDSTVFVDCSGEYYKIEKVIENCVQAAKKCLLICRKVVVSVPTRTLPYHIKECFLSQRAELHIVEPEHIRDICLFISFQTGQSYVCDLPNKVERD
ncbi:uncharacterized protein LOC135392379 [Ornithodoros turicata]|uniref:uncharacterized protein LOC135392379 n=1 Tax=Ornithodoros turicata TaxID=34597 RepID=UPI003138944D